ncbi:MAG TPA: hypothetical protein DHV08_05430, partial [Rhodocyclaceae bacterium]|nr:hypothetical protein [Rhodocyclaceae bacterium]
MNERSAQRGPLGTFLTLLSGAVLLVLGFAFSLIILAVVAVAALVLGGYFWWKTRELRKAMREHPPAGHVIEGEAVIVEEVRRADGERLPPDP